MSYGGSRMCVLIRILVVTNLCIPIVAGCDRYLFDVILAYCTRNIICRAADQTNLRLHSVFLVSCGYCMLLGTQLKLP
ncbi:uncharacterized protein V1513DRAFT_454961 [Lipomyces chichibuensis]|uniref:uncharacterized protein n=1 Tax=Lipomyces chichibuensis TaxID=1546026 RepID=UPI003344229B